MTFSNRANRIQGQPMAMSASKFDLGDKIRKKALSDANMLRNSRFALAIIQTLLANKGASAFKSIESVNLRYYRFSLLTWENQPLPKNENKK